MYVACNVCNIFSIEHDSAFVHLHVCMMQKIDWFFALSNQFTCIAIIYTAKTWHSFCSYTQNDSNIFAHSLQLIYNIHIIIAKTRLSFCTSTRLRDAVNWSIFRFIRLIYMHCNHIHCENKTQSLLIYTEWQQRLCAYVATHIRHTHIHCKDTIQLLCIYTLAWCSKSIGFSIFWSIYMRCKYINQSSSSSFSWVIIQRTQKLTSKWSTFIYIDQSSSSSLDLIIIQTSWKFTLKWSAFTILNYLYDHLII